MYNYNLECQHDMDFYNIDHYLTWVDLYGGNCKCGCKDKICEQKEIEVNGKKIKFNEFEIK